MTNIQVNYGYTHAQTVASNIWEIPHMLNCLPSVHVYVSYDGIMQRIIPLNIVINDNNHVTITFTVPLSGTAMIQ